LGGCCPQGFTLRPTNKDQFVGTPPWAILVFSLWEKRWLFFRFNYRPLRGLAQDFAALDEGSIQIGVAGSHPFAKRKAKEGGTEGRTD
jgi:hypothetical protein